MAHLIRRSQTPRQVSRSLPALWADWDDPFRVIDNLIRWEPFSLFDRGEGRTNIETFVPRFDVKEMKDNYIFRADLPGFKEEEIDISIVGNRMTVSGRKEEEEQREEEDNYLIMERVAGAFSRTFTLPDSVDTERIKAEMKNGVLEIELPKQPSAQPRRIAVGTQTNAGKGQIGSGGSSTSQPGGQAEPSGSRTSGQSSSPGGQKR